jgi:hypothetical protein
MGCILRVFGSTFVPTEFLKDSALSPSKVWRKGEPRLVGKRAGNDIEDTSGMNVVVSNADVGDFRQQARDAIVFLHGNKSDLLRLISLPGVEEVGLDFAVAWPEGVVTHTDYLPPELIRLAGELGLAIEVSHYPLSDEATAPLKR